MDLLEEGGEGAQRTRDLHKDKVKIGVQTGGAKVQVYVC